MSQYRPSATVSNHILTYLQIFEKSSFSQEVGAAVTMATPMTRIMRSWDIDLESAGATTYLRTQIKTAANLSPITPLFDGNYEAKYGFPMYTLHRADIHSTLRQAATSPNRPGRPAKLRLSSPIASYDGQAGSVTLMDGTTHTADLIIVADGLHSTAASYVNSHQPCPIIPKVQTVIRFLIPSSAITADPITAPILPGTNEINFFFAKDRYIIRYPCRNDTLQNFAMYINDPPSPSSPTTKPSETHADKHNQHITASDLTAAMKAGGFGPALLGLVDKIPSSSSSSTTTNTDSATTNLLPLWRTYDRPPLPHCTRGTLVVIGDAAHPMLPHKGQGFVSGAQDAAALATLFAPSSSQTSVEQKLALFDELRIPRTGVMQIYSSVDLTGNPCVKTPEARQWVERVYKERGWKGGYGNVDGNALPSEEGGVNDDVLDWILRYDVVEDVKQLMKERLDPINGKA
ncbi:Salicylate hydroxylase [Cyphellophora attinorum]|uniref:Salicylate hydroxylase n=1 Tax=Cyphellophora attinorum TaxID=1664694 RepID=A0A0N0NMP2_9EURO|nr:Salicylate hydroxylase [Phialophora attinorum]KPI40439.1 Salicylate hydroxylase [Phialophora attinorum]